MVFLADEIETEEVDANTLDNELSLLGIDTKVSLIKIDVEGAEYLVLEGAYETIKQHKPFIIIEFRPSRLKFLNITEDNFSLIKNIGYVFYSIHPDGALKEIKLINEHIQRGYDEYTDVLLSPVKLII